MMRRYGVRLPWRYLLFKAIFIVVNLSAGSPLRLGSSETLPKNTKLPFKEQTHDDDVFCPEAGHEPACERGRQEGRDKCRKECQSRERG